MCQICAVKEIASQVRWPKPLESPIKDLDFLVDTAHDEYIANEVACSKKETLPASLLDVVRLLATALDELERDRETWWTAPEKRAIRKKLEADCNQEKLTNLHKVRSRQYSVLLVRARC